MRSVIWHNAIVLLFLVPGAAAKQQDVVLLLNEGTRPAHVPAGDLHHAACVVPVSLVSKDYFCPPQLSPYYFVQGQRIELQVVNRKFFTDYSITIKAVTVLQSGPKIRNLEEAQNLTLGAPSLIPPPSKGGVEQLRQLNAIDMLNQLIDETQASQPETDLLAQEQELAREETQIIRDLRAFEATLKTLRTPGGSVDCSRLLGSPDTYTLHSCLERELTAETSGNWAGAGPFGDENDFRDNVIVRVNDLVTAGKTLAGKMADANIVQSSQQLDAEVTQYQKNVITFLENLTSASDAVQMLVDMINTRLPDNKTSLRTDIRLAQMRATLIKSLKADNKPALDDAELNQLLKKYAEFLRRQDEQAPRKHADSLTGFLIRPRDPERNASAFRQKADELRKNVDVDLRAEVEAINVAQSRLLTRMNEIYDRSEVVEALPNQIDLSGKSGNLIAYFTIRRIETFPRYSVPRLQGPGIGSLGGTQGTPLPAPGSATPNPAPPATTTPPAAQNAPGIVVAQDSFFVHDLYRANVVAAFAYSWLKDQQITKQPSTKCNPPSANCFSPFLASNQPQMQLILGVDFYFDRRDTFYDVSGHPGPDTRTTRQRILQETGFMGALSATQANNWFLGLFYEPVLGVQISSGINIGREKRLQSTFQFGVPVDMPGNFPTQDHQAKKAFVSVGLDLGLFRKIFGKITGVGTAASSTQGN
jgi:hypothetical protein